VPVSEEAFHFTEVVPDPPLPAGAVGVALVDFDGDGWLDMTVAGRTVEVRRGGPGGLFGAPERLPNPEGHDPYAVAWADIDDDGDLDLFVSSYDTGRHALWRNEAGQLVEDFVSLGVSTGPGAKGVAFSDLDGDGDLDLYIARGAFSENTGRRAPPGQQGLPNVALRNDGGTFTDVTESWQLAGRPGGESFVVLPIDANGDGRRDLIVVQDHVLDQLFVAPAEPNAPWTDRGSELIEVDGLKTSVMGMGAADVDGDGHLDVYGPQFATDALWMGTGNGFSNRFEQMLDGVDPTLQTKGWGAVLVDLDNDGDPDAASVASHHSFAADPSYPGTLPGGAVLLRTDRESGGARLRDVSASAGQLFDEQFDGWGLVAGDIDRDGALDLLIGVDGEGLGPDDNAYARSLLVFNAGRSARTNGWIRLRLTQSAPNPFAVGARIVVTAGGQTTSRLVLAGSSFCSQDPYEQHFGLGAATSADVEVYWPDGGRTTHPGLAPGPHVLTR